MSSRRQRQVQTQKTHQQLTANVEELQELAQLHLTEKEQLKLFGAVAAYRKQHNVVLLVEQLAPVCNTPAKRLLLAQIRRLLPDREYAAFDKLLAVHRLAPTQQPASTASSRAASAAGSRPATHSGRAAPAGRPVGKGSASLRQATPPVHGSVERIQPVAEPRQPARERVPRAKPTKIVIRPDDDGALGFDIRGGKEHGFGIFVSLVEEGSQAQKNGLEAGQLILKTNGVSFENISYQQAVQELTNNSAGNLKKIRLSVLQPGQYSSEQYPLVQYLWLDSHRNPTSPPPEYRSGVNLIKPIEDVSYAGARKVSIATDANKQLGISIRGGVEHGLGLYVSHVEPNALAHNYGLRIGDQILDINGLLCNTLMHDEAAEILQSNEVLVMTVRSVNKVPIRPVTAQDQVTVTASFAPARQPPSLTSNPGVRQAPAARHPVAAQRGSKRLSTSTTSSQDSFGSGRTPSPMDAQMAAAAPNYDPTPTSASQGVAFGPRTTNAYFGDLHTQQEDVAVSRNSLKQPERKASKHRNSYRHSGSFDDDVPSPLSEQMGLVNESDGRQNSTQPVTAAPAPAGSQWKPQGHPSPKTQPSRLGSSKAGPAAARAMIDKNAGLVLSNDDLLTLNYYLDQYVERNLSIKQLVMALSTLLDTPEKRQILEMVRAIVGQRDTDRYEELILPYLEEMRDAMAPNSKPRPKPPSRIDSLVEYAPFSVSSFGHNAYASGSESEDETTGGGGGGGEGAFDGTQSNTMDSMTANAGFDTPRSSTLNSEVTFATPSGSLLPSQGKKMQEAMATLEEKEEPSPRVRKAAKTTTNVKAPNGNQLKVYEEEFGPESPQPERKKSPAKIVSKKDDQPSTIPINRTISADLLAGAKLKPASTNESQVAPDAQDLPKENQQAMMLAETLVQRRNKINPGSIRRVVVRHGMPKSLSIDSQISAQPTEHEEPWEEDEDAENDAARRGTAGRKISKDSHVPQTIKEESPQASPQSSPRASPRQSRHFDSPLASDDKKSPDRRPPPSPSTAVKAIMNAANRATPTVAVVAPSPKMPRRVEPAAPQPAIRVPSPTSTTQSPVPMPRSGSRQSSLGSPTELQGVTPSPRLRRTSKLEAEESTEEVVSQPPGQFADEPTDAKPTADEVDGGADEPEEALPPLPVSSPPQLSPVSSPKDDSPAPPPVPEPAAESPDVQHEPAAGGDLYAVPEKPEKPQPYSASAAARSSPATAARALPANKPQEVVHVDVGEDLYAIPEKPAAMAAVAAAAAAPPANNLRDEVPPRRSYTEHTVPLEPSTRPGKTYAGYTGLFGDIKTILIEKSGKRLGIAVQGGANTKQREVRVKEIVAGGSAAACGALKVGMQILSVDGTSLMGLTHKQAVLVIKSCNDSAKLRLEFGVHVEQEQE